MKSRFSLQVQVRKVEGDARVDRGNKRRLTENTQISEDRRMAAFDQQVYCREKGWEHAEISLLGQKGGWGLESKQRGMVSGRRNEQRKGAEMVRARGRELEQNAWRAGSVRLRVLRVDGLGYVGCEGLMDVSRTTDRDKL